MAGNWKRGVGSHDQAKSCTLWQAAVAGHYEAEANLEHTMQQMLLLVKHQNKTVINPSKNMQNVANTEAKQQFVTQVVPLKGLR